MKREKKTALDRGFAFLLAVMVFVSTLPISLRSTQAEAAEGSGDPLGLGGGTEVTVDVTLSDAEGDVDAETNTVVTLNGSETKSVSVATGSAVTVDISTINHRYIESVTIGEETVNPSGEARVNYSKTLENVITGTSIDVVIARQYQLSCVTPAGAVVTVNSSENQEDWWFDKGTEVPVKVTPKEGYRIDSVSIGGETQRITDGKCETTVNVSNRDIAIVVTYTKIHTVKVVCGDGGSASPAEASVPNGEPVNIVLSPSNGYTVSSVEAVSGTVVNVDRDGSGTIIAAVGPVSNNETIKVSFVVVESAPVDGITIDDTHTLRKIGTDRYIIASGGYVKFMTQKEGIRLFDLNGAPISGGGENIQFVQVSQTQAVDTAELYYKADNEKVAEWHSVCDMDSIYVVVDETNPTVTVTPATAPTGDGYYGADVELAITANDNEAGIRKVEYWVVRSGETEPCVTSTTVYEYAGGDVEASTNVLKNVTVDAGLDNGAGVTVFVKVTDRAGNVTDASVGLKMNKTKPEMTVEFDGTPTVDTYFVADRTITLTVTDRADTFKAESVSATIKKDGVVQELNLSWNGQVATAELSEDGVYTDFAVTYTNKAGLSPESIGINGECTISFIMDQTVPRIKVEYSDDNLIKNEMYINVSRIATITITEKNFDASKVALAVTRDGETVTSYTDELKTDAKWTSAGDVHTALVIFAEEGNYTFAITCNDIATNAAIGVDYGTSKAPEAFVIDKTAPSVAVEYDNNTAENDKYFNENRIATITVTEKNFDASKVSLVVKRDGTVVDSYTQDAMLVSNWSTVGDVHTTTLEITVDGAYTFAVSCNDLAENTSGAVDYGTSVAPTDFVLDRVAPVGLEISYDDTVLSRILRSVTFGFYKQDVTVTLKAKDAIAGVASFKYSFTKADDAVDSEDGQEDVVTDAVTFADGIYSTSFKIPAQFRGKVSFSATDKVGNVSAAYTDGQTVVVDTVAPVVEVTFDNNDVKHDMYYSAGRTATITVEEANFFPEDVGSDYLRIEQIINPDSDNPEKTILTPVFSQKGEKWVTEIPFTQDNDYQLVVQYKDRAGNVSNVVDNRFVIDTTKPETKVEFDNNSVVNEKYFKAPRTATIVVTEKNFSTALVSATITRDKESVDELSAYLADDANWIHEGTKHTAKITFNGDYEYAFDITCKDLAENAADASNYGEAVAPNQFVVDVTKPVSPNVTYKDGIWQRLLETVTFGFYKAPAIVTIEAIDEGAGIDYFVYSYAVQEGESQVNQGAKDVVIRPMVGLSTGNLSAASFNIPAQFRGTVSFKAYDMAGNEVVFADTEKVVVVDDKKPVVDVVFDNNEAKNGFYYGADRTATISITEANFFEQDLNDEYLKLIVEKTTVDGKKTKSLEKPEFTKNGDVYTAKIEFKENAEYTFDIEYTDRSGNEIVPFEPVHFVVDKVKPKMYITYDDASGSMYFRRSRVATVTVEEMNFDPKDFVCNVVGTGTSNSTSGLRDYAAYFKNIANWTSKDNVWTASVPFDVDSNYDIKMNYRDLAGNEQESPIAESFCIDRGKPFGPTISYSSSIADVFLSNITFGFYKAPVSVTIEARDEVSGIDSFDYSYGLQNGVSDVNQGQSNLHVGSDSISRSGDTASASFTIPAQFRGYVSFTVSDRAGNTESYSDSKVIVVDDIAPVIDISYNLNDPLNGMYFGKTRIATITIDEANFFEEDLENGNLLITMMKKVGNETETVTYLKPEFTKRGDVYEADIEFAEDAAYRFNVSYKDRSGNESEVAEAAVFTVDKTAPEIQISYDNNSCKNKNQFNKNRTATITVTEQNFNPADMNYVVYANGTRDNSYMQYLQDKANWTSAGKVHTAKISFKNEAHYDIQIEYTDLAGNKNKAVDFGTSIAPSKFTLDKSAPTELSIMVNGESVLGGDSVAFDTFYAEPIAIMLDANCDISGLQELSYQKVKTLSEFNAKGDWEEYNEKTGIVIEPSEKLIIFFRAEDRAGNVEIVNSTGIIVDDKMPVGETKAPEIDIIPEQANVNGYYSDDVEVTLKVVDPKYAGADASADGFYSGLNTITYKIYADDIEAEETGILLNSETVTNGAEYDKDELIRAWSGKIQIDAETFNSNNVRVEIVAVDNAGNVRTSVTAVEEIKIDITAPAITVSYSNNIARSQRYFGADRVASIFVTERNFRPEDVVITLTNTDGVIPAVSAWTELAGDGNGDNTQWRASITYSADGDYTFGIAFTDPAGNANAAVNYGNSVAPTEFTMDQTDPVVAVSYDNNSVQNGNYYKEKREATIVITEHNLVPEGEDADRITITMTATDDGNEAEIPSVSEWVTNGDTHTAKIVFDKDAFYTFDISVRDKVDNAAEEFATQEFYVDKTAPTLIISEVENDSANTGSVRPVVTYSDTNFDAQQINLAIRGENRGVLKADGVYADITNGRVFTFNDFADEKSNDDIYTIEASLTDKAGNVTTQSVRFSINRYGSTYMMEESSKEILGTYTMDAKDFVVKEINADELKNVKITLFKNNETIILNEGADYRIDVLGSSGQWKEYTYVIFSKNFEDDGVYRVSVYSEDAAGNIAENTQDTKESNISFGVDKTAPTVVIGNLEAGKTYAMDSLSVQLYANDNLLLDRVDVYLDDYENVYQTWSAAELEEIFASLGEIQFDIAGESTSAHNLMVVCADAAGNELVEEITDFYVTTNIAVQFYNNKILFYGSIVGVVLAVAVVVFGVVYKGRKKAAK